MSAPADFRDKLVRRRDACVKFLDDKPRKNRKDALDFYHGVNLPIYGDSGDGLSTVVSRDVFAAIESLMPPLLRPFVAGEQVVQFDPVEAGDEDAAKQATEYVNYVFRRHNNVLHVVQDALKDGLLFRLGIAKTVMQESEDGEAEEYEGMQPHEMTAKRGELALSGRDFAGDISQDPETGLMGGVVPPKKVVKFKVHIIAPDEFLYEQRLASLCEATFLGHRKKMTLGDLIDMGIDPVKAKALDSGKPDTGTNDEDRSRFDDESGDNTDWNSDDIARPVWVDECYIRCDYRDNGVLVWRKALLGGAQSVVLSDEPADDHPYSTWTPIPMPHKLVGLSYYDVTRDIQMTKTALTREQLNNAYLVNRPQRMVLEGQVNIDDLLNPAVNGTVRVRQMGAVQPLITPFVAAEMFQMIEYQDSQLESRTGVTRYNQGMDSNSLNKTATGMNIISNNSQQRQELVARQFGEFLKDIFMKTLALVKTHADPQDVARLLDGFVPWPSEYDATVSVGLGTNNKDQLVGHLMQLITLDQSIVQLQQGINGPLVDASNVYEKLKRVTEAMGLKGSGYYTDPNKPPEQGALPPPQEQQGPPVDPLGPDKIKADTELKKADIKAHSDTAVALIHHGIGPAMQPPVGPTAIPEQELQYG